MSSHRQEGLQVWGRVVSVNLDPEPCPSFVAALAAAIPEFHGCDMVWLAYEVIEI